MINLGAEHENLDQKAYSILKDLIIERKLLPGQKIPQEKLARDLGISRTPLISALKFLEQEKLRPEEDYKFVRECAVHFHIKDVASDGSGWYFTEIGQGTIDYQKF
jgi:DNA-binding transcriptional MocR family regulator